MGQALRLASNFVILSDKFKANTVEVTQDLYEHLDEEYKEFAGHLLISSYAFDADWPTWEVHTARIRSHTVMMFVTPGEGTVKAEEPVRGTP
jgi:hypothetical protein